MSGGYTEAQYRATMKYREENLKTITVSLNLSEDSDIINDLEDAKQHGITRRQWMRALFDGDTPSGDLVEKVNVEKLLWEHRIPPQTIKAIMDGLK